MGVVRRCLPVSLGPKFPHVARGAQQMKPQKSLEWKRLYQKAIAESDPEQLPEEIARAEAAILSRQKNSRQMRQTSLNGGRSRTRSSRCML